MSSESSAGALALSATLVRDVLNKRKPSGATLESIVWQGIELTDFDDFVEVVLGWPDTGDLRWYDHAVINAAVHRDSVAACIRDPPLGATLGAVSDDAVRFLVDAGVKVVAYMPPRDVHLKQLASRDKSLGQPTEDDIDRVRSDYDRVRRMKGVVTAQSLEEAVKMASTGEFVYAPSGSGKTHFVREAADAM